ncbi:septum formation family protein [Actinoplanes awajinensis]|uniref:septum formation family protein n=1 Tax=Actinoplanes awajinensis TaxID=135946 RepID=UPI0012FA3BE1|nr:septum formation family protein [Actinoplanes awajinensis]
MNGQHGGFVPQASDGTQSSEPQPYPEQAYPAQPYAAQPVAPQAYPGQPGPAQPGTPQAYPAQPYPAQAGPPQVGPVPEPGVQFGQPWPDSAERSPSKPPRSPRTVWGTIKTLIGVGIVVAFAGGVFYTHVIDPDRDDAGNVRGDRSITYADVRVGDCAKLNPFIRQDSNVDVTPCTSTHNAEVVARHTMPKGDWPGEDAVDKTATTECSKQLESYAGKSADVEPIFAVPTESTWSRDRDIVCFAYRSGGGLTKSLRK